MFLVLVLGQLVGAVKGVPANSVIRRELGMRQGSGVDFVKNWSLIDGNSFYWQLTSVFCLPISVSNSQRAMQCLDLGSRLGGDHYKTKLGTVKLKNSRHWIWGLFFIYSVNRQNVWRADQWLGWCRGRDCCSADHIPFTNCQYKTTNWEETQKSFNTGCGEYITRTASEAQWDLSSNVSGYKGWRLG